MRFILDVMSENGKEDDILNRVLTVLDRDEFLSSTVSSIRCVDTTNDNQFYGEEDALKNTLTYKQLNADLKYWFMVKHNISSKKYEKLVLNNNSKMLKI
jgi:hypothetical protein